MRNIIVACTFSSVTTLALCQSSDRFKEAIAAWSFSDPNDLTKDNSQFEAYGNIQFITLEGQEAKESIQR